MTHQFHLKEFEIGHPHPPDWKVTAGKTRHYETKADMGWIVGLEKKDCGFARIFISPQNLKEDTIVVDYVESYTREKRGGGRCTVNAVLDYAKQIGAKKIKLESMRSTQGFWKKMGWKCTGKKWKVDDRPGHNDGGSDLIKMQCRI